MPIDYKKNAPIIIAVAVALIALIYYMASGISSKDTNVRELQKGGQVERVGEAIQEDGQQKMTITCKNGESYEILYQKDQANFQDLVYNKCGEQGER